jgi:protein-S-isoprenylcysteine O-methyltransferase Ste14
VCNTIVTGVLPGSPGALILLPVAMFVIDRGPMTREEAYMERKFGDEYRAYTARVRRWI